MYFDLPASPGCGTTVATCLPGSSLTSEQIVFYDTNGTPTTSDDTDLAIINWTAANLSGVTISNLQFDGGGAVQYLATTGPFDTNGTPTTSDDTDLAIINWTAANLSGVTISNLQFDGGGAVQYLATTGPCPVRAADPS